MKPVAFEYCRPDSVAAALDLLAEWGEEASVLAGGMSLGPMLNLRMVRPRAVIDIGRIDELSGIQVSGDRVLTGALLGQADALASEALAREVPLLRLALPWVGHFQTRNRGTLGGSVAHADPSAELPLCLVTLGGAVVLRSKRGERRVAACDFFLGPLATARAADELVVALEWPRAAAGTGYGFSEFAQRHGDFAIAAAACALRLDGAGRIAALALGLGGVEDRPLALDTSASLGRRFDAAAAAEIAAAVVAPLSPMADRSADADYRRQLARTLTSRVLREAAERAR